MSPGDWRGTAVWHIRDRVATDYLPDPAVWLVRLLARVLPTGVIANSHETMSTLPERWHSSVLYNPIFPDAVDPASATAAAIRGLTIGMIGRLTPWKGQDVFLDAFAEAFKGGDVRARIIGSALFGEDAYADSLMRGRAPRYPDQVEFRGFREDVFAELGSSTSSSTAPCGPNRSARWCSRGWRPVYRSSPRTPAAPRS